MWLSRGGETARRRSNGALYIAKAWKHINREANGRKGSKDKVESERGARRRGGG